MKLAPLSQNGARISDSTRRFATFARGGAQRVGRRGGLRAVLADPSLRRIVRVATEPMIRRWPLLLERPQ